MKQATPRRSVPAGLAALLILALAVAPVAAASPGAAISDPAGAPAPTRELVLEFLGRYAGVGSEIAAYDPTSQRLFVTAAVDVATDDTVGLLEIIDISDPANPTQVNRIDVLATLNGIPNSVAIKDGLVAAAVEPADDPQANGMVAFYDADGAFIASVTVGAMPDMITFTPDGQKVLTANEGEPGDDVDPEGSVSIVDISAGPANSQVMTADFSAFDGRENEMRARGVRIFPGKRVAEDVEPEYIALSPDGSMAFVTLQEANAFAVVDVTNATVKDILPMGLKDHSRGPATLTSYPFGDLPDIGATPAGQTIKLGGLSGLWFEGMDKAAGTYRFVTVPDRGPNGAPTDVDDDGSDERPFALPGYQARIVRFELDPASGEIAIVGQLMLTRSDGVTPISGLPNIPGVDEEPVDLFGDPLPYDELGADLEGIVVAPDGTYWMVDEYRPAIYHFAADGSLIDRLVPQGTAALAGQAEGAFGRETLPAEYATRRSNRGFEGMALDTDDGILYAFIQTPLANPNRAASDASDVIRMLGIDPATGLPVAEYVYLLEAPDYRTDKVDKMGDAAYAGNHQFYTVERDSSTAPTGKKFIFKVDLAGATNLLAADAPPLMDGKTLEQHSADDLAAQGIRPVDKVKVANLPSIGYLAGDKPEGLAMLPDGRLAVLNDNDFGLLDEEIPGDGSVPLNPSPVPVVLGIIDFPAGNALDASDRDSAINIQNWPVHGVFMPDGIASFESGGMAFYVTANEGDDRGEDERIKDLELDPVAFPDAAALQENELIGRLGASSIDGDIDGDGEYEQLWAYGARSFTIWDSYGNLVYDSSDDFEMITARQVPERFNSDGDADSFDSRSDNKGPEPEGVTTGSIGGFQYAFVALERVGGVMVYNVTDPARPSFVLYEPSLPEDRSPEGILYIPGGDSPTGSPLLVLSHEVSGTVAIYQVNEAERTVLRSRRYNLAMDTFIDSSRPAANFGSASTMWVGDRDWLRPVVWADLPVCDDKYECIPSNSVVDHAYLYVYVTEGRGFANWDQSRIDAVSAHALLSPWQEGSATWFAPWNNPGGDVGPALSATHLGNGKVGTWLRFDITGQVAAIVRGEQQNYGFLLASSDDTWAGAKAIAGVRYGLATQEYWDASKAGYVRVIYRTLDR